MKYKLIIVNGSFTTAYTTGMDLDNLSWNEVQTIVDLFSERGNGAYEFILQVSEG